MVLLFRKRSLLFFTGILLFGVSCGIYNFALHPNMYNWEKDRVLVRNVNTDKKVIALTFDDGPDPVNTPAMLKVLKKHQIRATFFVVGTRAEKQPELLLEMAIAGHEIGNHSYSHADFNHKENDFILKEIKKTNELIFEISGQKPKYFRPPGGYLSYAMVDLAVKEGMIIGYWTYQQDSKDWRAGTTADDICQHIMDNLKPGQIIILHEGASNGSETVKAVDILISRLKEKGYSAVPLGELVKLENEE